MAKSGEIKSSQVAKIYDPAKKGDSKLTFSDTDNLSILLSGKGSEQSLDYNYLDVEHNLNYDAPANKDEIDSMFLEVSNLVTETDESGKQYTNNLSQADIDAALKSDKYEVTQVYSPFLRDKGFALTNKATGADILIPKSLTEALPQKSFSKDDNLDLYKIISNSSSGTPETDEVKKLKEKFGISTVEVNSKGKTATFQYKDKLTKPSILPLSIADDYISKESYDTGFYKSIPKDVKAALWTELSAKSEDKQYIKSGDAADVMGSVSKDANVFIDKIKASMPDATAEQVAKLMTVSNKVTLGKSYYDDPSGSDSASTIKAKRLNDYLALTKAVPASVTAKGPDAVKAYRDSTISILETCGEYGAMYIKQLPDPENLAKHADGLKRLSEAAEKTQGCKFTNATLFNGFTADELEKKVVIPNEKLAKGEKVGAEGETLVMIAHEGGTDYNGAFKPDFGSDYMHSKEYSIGNKTCKFDESFLGHYDSILVIQPNGKTADDTLNKAFATINKGLDEKAKVDMTFVAHSGGGQPFLSLPIDKYSDTVFSDNLHYGDRLHSTMMDSSDFGPDGQPFSKDMQAIFQKSIDNGHTDRKSVV